MGGTSVPIQVPRPVIGGREIESDQAFLLIAVSVLLIAAVATLLVKRGTTGATWTPAGRRWRRIDRHQPPPGASHGLRGVGRAGEASEAGCWR